MQMSFYNIFSFVLSTYICYLGLINQGKFSFGKDLTIISCVYILPMQMINHIIASHLLKKTNNEINNDCNTNTNTHIPKSTRLKLMVVTSPTTWHSGRRVFDMKLKSSENSCCKSDLVLSFLQFIRFIINKNTTTQCITCMRSCLLHIMTFNYKYPHNLMSQLM